MEVNVGVVQWIVQGVIALLLAVVAYFLKSTRDGIDRDIRERKKETDKLRDEIVTMQTNLPLVYVLREDYIRTMAGFDNKLDRLLQKSRGGE